MASSTLDPENIPERDRRLGKGHGTEALGPSDTSDSGSDVQSGLRWPREADIGLDKGTNEDEDTGRQDPTAGPDIGDAELDSDTDADGTGERGTAGRDSDIEMGQDIDTDHIEYVNPDEEPDTERSEHPDRTPRRSRQSNRPQEPEEPQ